MIGPALLSAVAALGVYLIVATPPARAVKRSTKTTNVVDQWLTQAGLAGVSRTQALGVTGGVFVSVAFVAWLLFGGFLAPLVAGSMVAAAPAVTLRSRRRKRLAEAAEGWPRMIDEIRLMCGSLGRPIPQALLAVGKKGPVEYRGAFAEAEREWLLTTDFDATVTLLRNRLADPTADVVCETLLVAHSVGGTDVDQRLAALAKDRHVDLQGRKDARSKQAGVIFARRFVLVVPLGMAFVGMSIGNGREAYSSFEGQVGVAAALVILGGCWLWAGQLIRLPRAKRAFRA